jgi:clan AA aspartic protease
MTLRRAHHDYNYYKLRTEGTSLTGGKRMGYVYAEIDLTSEDDLALARHGGLRDDQVRTVRVRALVDSGAWDLTISEDIRQQLGLPLVGKDWVKLADETMLEIDLAGPIHLRFETQVILVHKAIVMPKTSEVLLGALAMQGLDVYIDPKSERLVVPPQTPDNPKWKIRHYRRVVSPSI